MFPKRQKLFRARLFDIATLHFEAIDPERGEVRITTSRTQKIADPAAGPSALTQKSLLPPDADRDPIAKLKHATPRLGWLHHLRTRWWSKSKH